MTLGTDHDTGHSCKIMDMHCVVTSQPCCMHTATDMEHSVCRKKETEMFFVISSTKLGQF